MEIEELAAAERLIIKDIQQTVYEGEIRLIEAGKALPKSNNLASLCPFIGDDKILRVGGRLKNADISYDGKHPVILPGHHNVTRMLVEWTHRKNGHVGVEHVLALLHASYWIVGARRSIKSVLRRCFFCEIKRAMQMFPIMADLPVGRMAFNQPPFTHTGVDLFGPVFIKEGRKRLKRWVVLFTCLTVRAIHLEVAETCETDSFINSLRRFVNRRGCPSIMYSDQGTNFQGATSELKEVVTKLRHDPKVKDFATSLKITWNFNPPASPHMGGIWERLVRSVKEVMTGIAGKHTLTDPQLLTLLTEVESVLNTRPLTHASDDVRDLEALTPNHILLGKHRNWASIADVEEREVTSRKKYRQVQALAMVFWTRWKKEYLPALTKRSKWKAGTSNFVKDELVILQEDNTKRGCWPLARIVEVMPAKDGVTRVVKVRTKDGEYVRPVTKLFKLEDNAMDNQAADATTTMPTMTTSVWRVWRLR